MASAGSKLQLLFLFVLAPTVHSADFCKQSNTNQLVWNKSFERTIEAFFGSARASLYHEDAEIAEQAMTGLGGPPDKLKLLSEGRVLASACRAESCTEKAAVVVSCPDAVEAVGIIHYTCENSGEWQVCPDQPTLSVYLGKGADPSLAPHALKAWAINALPKSALPLRYDYRSHDNKPVDPPPKPGAGVTR